MNKVFAKSRFNFEPSNISDDYKDGIITSMCIDIAEKMLELNLFDIKYKPIQSEQNEQATEFMVSIFVMKNEDRLRALELIELFDLHSDSNYIKELRELLKLQSS